MNQPEWMARAACRGADEPDLWFPTGAQEPDPRALAACQRCPVTRQCLDYSLKGPGERIDLGVWGGLGDDERYLEKRRRRQRVNAA